MASLLAIYGDIELCKKTKVIFISVVVIKHSEAHLTQKIEVQKIGFLALKHCITKELNSKGWLDQKYSSKICRDNVNYTSLRLLFE